MELELPAWARRVKRNPETRFSWNNHLETLHIAPCLFTQRWYVFVTCLALSWLYHSVLQELYHHKVVELHQVLFVGIILCLRKIKTPLECLCNPRPLYGITNRMRYLMIKCKQLLIIVWIFPLMAVSNKLK